jgi:dihydroorotase
MNRGSILIKGGRLADPSLPLDALRDVRITGGVVYEIGEGLQARDSEVVFDATNAVVAPGLVDMHVHLRFPGFPEKETIATGTEAAVRGGFTAVACMPNTQPALDDPSVLRDLLQAAAADGRCSVYPIGAITRARLGAEPCDFSELARAGAVAFSDDGATVEDARVLRDAALAAHNVDRVFISHCEDEALKAGGVMNEGEVSRAMGVPGAPSVAEDAIVARDLLIAADTAKAWHIAHLTTRAGLDLIRHFRAYGLPATCEVTPHHLNFTDAVVRELRGAGRVNPPLRTDDDVRALRDGVRDGTIDVFASDHAPHTREEKMADLAHAEAGFSGLEIAVGAYAAALPELPMLRFVAMLSTNPSRILGIGGGTLAVGSRGDATIFADRSWLVDPSKFASKGRSTPFAGRTLPRQVLATVVNGSVAFAAS